MSNHKPSVDGVPSEPIAAVGTTHQQHEPAHTMSNNQATQIPYDSNPFTISIRGFQLLMKYAQSIVITILVIGLISFTFNLFSQIISTIAEDASAQSSQSQEDLQNTLLQGACLGEDDCVEEFSTSTNDTSRLQNTSDDISAGAVIGIVALVIGVTLVIVVITLPISAAFSAAYKGFIAAGTIAAIHNRHITFGEAFSEMGNRFGTLFFAELIAILKIFGGYLLFVVPGVRAQLRYEALPYVIMWNKEISASGALATTKDLYKGHLMEIFGIRFFAAIIPAIGQAFASGGVGLSLQQITAYKQANLATPKTHWLNYIGLLVLIALLLFIALTIGVVIFVAVANA